MEQARALINDMRRQRSMALLACGLGLSLAVNFFQGLQGVQGERQFVLVPAVSGPVWELGESWAGRVYFEDVVRTTAVTLLTVTPANLGYVREAADRLVHVSARSQVLAWLDAQAEAVREGDISTAFYPARLEADPAVLEARVEGELITWLGEAEAERRSVAYRFSFVMEAGRLALTGISQIEEEPS